MTTIKDCRKLYELIREAQNLAEEITSIPNIENEISCDAWLVLNDCDDTLWGLRAEVERVNLDK